MQNAYAIKMQQKKAAELERVNREGFDFALKLCVVALNNVFGFGADRITKLEKEINRLIEEEFSDDVEKAAYDIIRRIDQIRKKGANK